MTQTINKHKANLRKMFLSISVVLTPILAQAFSVDGIYYTITSSVDTARTVGVTYKSGYNTYSGDVTIPSSVTYNGYVYKVTSIENGAFRDCADIKSISIPSTVTTFKDYAFYRCYGLTEFTVPNTVTTIKNNAFDECTSLTRITLPDSLKTIESYLFEDCNNLQKVNIPEKVTSIRNYAFYNCNKLDTVIIPESVTTIGNYALSISWGTPTIIMKGTIPPSITEYSFNKSYQIIYVPKGAGHTYSNATYWTNFAIIDGDKPIKVEVTLSNPGSLGNEILKYVEYVDEINDLVVSGTLNSDDYYQINNMKNLMSIDMSNVEMTTLSQNYFKNKHKIRNIKLPSKLTSIGNYAFYGCYSLNNITLPNTLKSIGDYSFYECYSLNEIKFPDSLTSIGSYAFQYSYLKSIEIPDNVSTINYCTFDECSKLTSVKLPKNLKSIDNYAFENCKALTSINFPETLTSINYRAFGGCTGLTEITLPAKVNYCDCPFYDCSNITKITSLASCPPALASSSYDILYNVSKQNVELLVPSWSLNEYKLTTGWDKFITINPINTIIDNIDVINRKLTFEDGQRPSNEPNVKVFTSGKLEVLGDDILSMKKYTQCHSIKLNSSDYNNSSYSSMINQSGTMRADSVALSFTFNYSYQRWAFITLPFDCKIADIEIPARRQMAIRRYDGESRAQGNTANWKNLTSDMTLNAGEGYIIQLDSTATITFKALNNTNKNNIFTNTEVSKSLNEYTSEYAHNRSWNFIGNPYQCYYDIRFMNFNSPITYYTGKGYAAASPLDDSFILAPSQGFFIQKPVDVDNLTFSPEGRQFDTTVRAITNNVSSVKASNKSLRELFDLTISDNDGIQDKTRIVLNQMMTTGYDLSRDASKFANESTEAAQLYTFDNATRYAINERPVENGLVNLGFYAGKEGEYSISLSRNTSDRKLLLIDNLTKTETLLDPNGIYTFTSKAGSHNDRFIVSFNIDPAGINNIEDVKSTVSSTNNAIIINTKPGNSISIYNLSGQLVDTTIAIDNTSIVNINAGFYIVKVGNDIFKTAVNE